MITLNSKEECCGCGACSSVCPQNAITMQENEDGFIYPMVDCLGEYAAEPANEAYQTEK